MSRKLFTDPIHPPQVGDKIYVPTQWYLSHGADDIAGGLATVAKVTPDTRNTWVEVQEVPCKSYNWNLLSESQEKFMGEFGEQVAHPDPDDHPDSNRWD